MTLATKKKIYRSSKSPAAVTDMSLERYADIEWRKCKLSLHYYLTHYVYIQDRIQQAIVHWQDWPHLLELVRIVQRWRDTTPRIPIYVMIFKSRQVGASTTVAGIVNWIVHFHESSKVEQQSETGAVAMEMLDRSRFINDHHPGFLRLKYLPDQTDNIGMPATNSKIVAMASTPNKGRTSDATMVVCDEWEFHPYAEEGFRAVQPAMARGGLFIGCSTIDKTRPESYPKKVWLEAKQAKNGFIPLFWDYFSVPGRTEETYQRDTAGMADWAREGEYPRNEMELMAPPKSTGYFNHDILAKMLLECRDPLEVRYGGLVKIYTPPITNRKFVFAVDSSQGQEDPSVGIISDAQTDEDVACFHGRISLDEQARIIWELYQEYNEPVLSVERNASGLTLIDKLTILGVKNWFYSDRARQKPGWYTHGNGPENREKILAELAEEIHLRRKRIPIKDCVEQMFDFAWVNGRAQALKGRHDDWVMCEAILGQAKKQASYGIRVTSAKYRG